MEDKSEAAMEEGVRGSKCVLAILTDDGGPGHAYFERPYCVQELQWAVDGGHFIQPICDVDDKKRIGELLSKAPADLKEIVGGTEFIELIRSKKQYWKVGMDLIVNVRAKLDGYADSETPPE